MQLTKEQAQELKEVIEDSVEYFCDNELLSGELAWKVVEALSVAKQAEFRGEVTADWYGDQKQS